MPDQLVGDPVRSYVNGFPAVEAYRDIWGRQWFGLCMSSLFLLCRYNFPFVVREESRGIDDRDIKQETHKTLSYLSVASWRCWLASVIFLAGSNDDDKFIR